MTKLLKFNVRAASALVAMAAIASFAGSAPRAWARPDYMSTVPMAGAGRVFETSRGPAYVTGGIGSTQTTTVPGTAGQGLLMNNGNGTSTFVVPGALPQVVATPR
jgi:hypothetical protein